MLLQAFMGRDEIRAPLKTPSWSLVIGTMSICGLDPFNQYSHRSDREKWSTSKGGLVFSKLFRLDRINPLRSGPKFPEISVEWIAPCVS